jgi:cobalt transporter subunit CbtA
VIQRVLTVGLVAGLAAGLAIAALQHMTTTPLILAAEVFEAAQQGHGGAADAAAPAGDLARTATTGLAAVGVSIGYALILLAAMLVCGERIAPRRAALWGACAFAATGLATGLGLAPQLPGAAETDLAGRQIWWLATACLTAAGLFALLRVGGLAAKLAGALALAAPHLYGAPQPAAPESTVPAELAARFAASSISVQALSWILAGALVGCVWRLLGEREDAAP